MITGFSTHWCQVSDMERAVGFYRDVLGLQCGNVNPYWTEFSLGDAKFALHHQLDGAQTPLGARHSGWMMALDTTDIKALRQRLETAGAKVWDYHDTPGGVTLDFEDPDGNPLEAIQRGMTASQL